MEGDVTRQARWFLERLGAADWDDEEPRMALGIEALPDFVDAFAREHDPARRSRLIRVIWQFRDRSALPVLAEALQDSRDQVWKDALDGVVTLGGEQALEILRQAEQALDLREPGAVNKQSWIVEAAEQVREDIQFDDADPLWKRIRRPRRPRTSIDEHTREAWRELGFCCILDKAAKSWRLAGSRSGLLQFRDLLLAYAAENPGHHHLGPYFSPTLYTRPLAMIDERGVSGTLNDFTRLAELVNRALDRTEPGSVATIRDEFASHGDYALELDVRSEDFDPASADPALERRAL